MAKWGKMKTGSLRLFLEVWDTGLFWQLQDLNAVSRVVPLFLFVDIYIGICWYRYLPGCLTNSRLCGICKCSFDVICAPSAALEQLQGTVVVVRLCFC